MIMTSLSTTCVEVPDHVIVRGVGDEAVLLDIETDEYYALDATGYAMFTAATSSSSLQVAVDGLFDSFDGVDREKFTTDFAAFMAELLEAGLLALTSVGAGVE